MRWSSRTDVEHAAPAPLPNAAHKPPGSPRPAEEDPSRLPEELNALLARLRGHGRPDNAWFAAIDDCREKALGQKHDLDRSLAGLTLPLRPELQAAARRCADNYWTLARCYLEAAEMSETDASAAVDPARLALTCYRGMESLAEYLMINYERYSRIRKGAWLDVHKLYGIALSEGVQHLPVGAESSPHTVEHEYKRLLLLGLSDPFHYPFRGLVRIYDHLEQWAALASLSSTSTTPGRCLFVVDPALDHPASPALPHSRIRPQFNEKWLGTRELVDHLKREHEKAVNTAVSEHGGRPQGITENLDSIDLLRRLVVHWGLHPIRRSARTRTYRNCDVVIGLKQVYTTLNALNPTDNPAGSGSGSKMSHMIKGTFGQQLYKAEHTPLLQQWEITDESEYGFRLLADDPQSAGRVAVGELVAVRSDSSRDWCLGNIHWAQTEDLGDGREALSAGIKKIPVPARPAIIAHIDTEKSPGPPGPALLLMEEGGPKPVVSLLCNRGAYSPTGMYLVRRVEDGQEYIVEATNVKLATRAFVWFEIIKPRADTREKTLGLILPNR
jgi:hypothetical protein